MRRRLILIGLVLTAFLPGHAASADLAVMQGPVTMHTASLWLQSSHAAQARVEYREGTHGGASRQSQQVRLDASQDYSAQFKLTGLLPGKTYRYRVLLDGAPAREGRFRTLPAWNSNKGPFDFTVYFGSCAFLPNRGSSSRYGRKYQVFDHIAEQALANPLPSFMLWDGDTVYYRDADLATPAGMDARQRSVRHHPALQKLFAILPHYAIWDDHDYGPNDSDRSFALKETSLRLFKQYWANPSYGLPEQPGLFTHFSMADTEFFLLDDRYCRDNDRAADVPGKQLYGSDQLNWLENALLASHARFKFIVGGSQFLNDRSTWEGWQHFRKEREDFLDWLVAHHIDGVIFLSGDRHRTELLRIERPGTYPLHELTCSPLTSQPRKAAEETVNPRRVENTLTEQRNFCTLDLTGGDIDRELTLRAFDSTGRKLWEISLAAATLTSP
jgi:alkaline phosphatase D